MDISMSSVMKRAKALVAVALGAAVFAIAAPAMAQEVPPEQLALARQYIDLTDRASVYEVTLVEIGLGTLSQITSQNPELAEEADKAVGRVLATYQDRKSELLDQFARVYALHFSVEELQQIVAFYETPTGMKLAQVNNEVNNDIRAVLEVFTNNTRREFFAKVRTELRALGFEV